MKTALRLFAIATLGILLAFFPVPLEPGHAQEITVSVPIHPDFSFDPLKPLMTFQESTNSVADETQWCNQTGQGVKPCVKTCWADFTGQLNCIGGFPSAPHNLLSVTHPDTIPFSPPAIGDIIRGNNTNGPQLWERYAIVPVAGDVLTVTASGPNFIPTWQPLPGGGQPCTTAQLDTQHDIHASTTGNDLTGNGTIGTPYRTVVRALQDVPFLICGRWVIHLDTVGTYVGQVNVAGRVFGGGGANYNSGDVHWPWSANTVPVTNDTWPYSWLEIVGSTAASESYILQESSGAGVDGGLAVISLSHANVTLRGLTLFKGGFGASVDAYSFLNLAGVLFHDCITSVSAGFYSHIHGDASGFVDNDGVTMARVTNDNTLGGGATFGFLIHDHSFMDDSDQTGGDNGSGGTACANCLFDYHDTVGDDSAAYFFDSESAGHIVGNLNCEQLTAGRCLIVRASSVDLNQGSFTGASNDGLQAIELINGHVGSDVGGFGVTLTNWGIGVSLTEGSTFDSNVSPTFVNVTQHWQGDQGSPNSESIHSRDVFMGLGLLPFDVSEAGAFTPNLSQSTFWRITLTANSTMNAASFGNDGSVFKVLVCQDGVGAHTLTFNAAYHGAGTISGAANSCSQQSFTFRSSTSIFYADSAMVTGM